MERSFPGITEEEKKIQEKIKAVNKQYAEYLKSQMGSGKKKGGKDIMTKEEYLLNKGLLQTIEGKDGKKEAKK